MGQAGACTVVGGLWWPGLVARAQVATPDRDADARDSAVQLLRALVGDAERPLTGLSVAWLQGETLASRAWAGWARIGEPHPARSVPLTGDTVFPVGGLSLLPLCLTMLRLHDARVLDLDADLTGLLAIPPRSSASGQPALTPRRILSMRSGLRNGLILGTSGTALRQALSNPDSWQPNARDDHFNPSALAWVALATAMERAAAQPYDALVQRWLCEPLGLTARYHPPRAGSREEALYAGRYGWSEPLASWVAQSTSMPASGKTETGTGQTEQDASPAATARERIGENAVVHRPHDGWWCSVPDLSRLARLLIQQGRWDGRRMISGDSYEQLLRSTWQASPGWQPTTATTPPTEPQHDPWETPPARQVRNWALGLQRFVDQTDEHGGDRLHSRGDIRGHGLITRFGGLRAGLLFEPPVGNQPGWGIVYVGNGTSTAAAQAAGAYSGLSRAEERVIELLLDHLQDSAVST
jgi:CubicO group peptidase (beta-lactamase class C family)